MIKKTLLIFCFILTFSFLIFPADSKIIFNGSYESIFDTTHETDYFNKEYQAFSWGLNNYLNLRMKANINEYLTFGMSININMFAGNYTDNYRTYFARMSSSVVDPMTQMLESDNLFSMPFYYKNTYIGSFDLERLYFKVGNDYFDIESGLVRLAKGYSLFFSPMDFFNPKDPLNPNARPEGKLALIATFYPMDMWKIEAFAVAPDNPVKSNGWDFKFGASTEFNIDKLNFQFLYTLFMPEMAYQKDQEEEGFPAFTNNDFSHIIGFSMKADIEVGLFIDTVYRFDQMVFRENSYYDKEFYIYRGLEFAIGVDYTIDVPNTDSNIYLLLEYMFYGSGMLDWQDKDLDELYIEELDDDELAEYGTNEEDVEEWKVTEPIKRSGLWNQDKKPLNFLRHDYIYGMIKYTINTYVTVSTSYLFGIDDQSGLLSVILEIEPFQAFTISFTASYPFGWEMIDYKYYRGEFGSTNVGYYQNYKFGVKLKF